MSPTAMTVDQIANDIQAYVDRAHPDVAYVVLVVQDVPGTNRQEVAANGNMDTNDALDILMDVAGEPNLGPQHTLH